MTSKDGCDLISWSVIGAFFASDIGDYRAKKVGFRTCAIVVLLTAQGSRMKIDNIDIQATIEKAQSVIRQDTKMSAATQSMFEILILVTL